MVGRKNSKSKTTFNIGDWVRISFLKELFDREYSERWSREYYKVVKRECMQGKPLYMLVTGQCLRSVLCTTLVPYFSLASLYNVKYIVMLLEW